MRMGVVLISSRFLSREALTVILIAFLLLGGLAVNQRNAVATSNTIPFSLTISGDNFVLNASPDLCAAIPFHFSIIPSHCPFNIQLKKCTIKLWKEQ